MSRPALASLSVTRLLTFLLLGVGMLPMLVLGVAMLGSQARREHDFRREQLAHSADTIQSLVAELLRDQRKALEVAAADLTGVAEDRAIAADVLSRLKRSSDAFVTVMKIGPDGKVVAGLPDRADPITGRSVWSGISVADREYFRAIATGGTDHVSGAFRGRGFGDDLLVAVSRRVEDDAGDLAWVLQASIRLQSLQEWLDQGRGLHGFEYVVTDAGGKVLAASDAIGATPLEPFDRGLLARWPLSFGEAPLLSYEARTAEGWTVWLGYQDRQTAGEFIQRLWIPVTIAFGTLAIVGWLVAASIRLVRNRVDEALLYVDQVADDLVAGRPIAARPLIAHTIEGGRLASAVEGLARRLRDALDRLGAELDREVELRHELDQLAANQERWLDIRTRDLQDLNRKLIATQRFVESAEVAGRVGFWETDTPTGPMRLSGGAVALLRLPSEFSPGRDLDSGLDDASRQELQRDLTRAWFEGRDFNLDVAWRSEAMLAPLRLRISGRAIRGPDGLSLRLVGAVFDLTSQYEAEQRVRRISRATTEVNDLLVSSDFDDARRLALLVDRLMVESGARAVLGFPPGATWPPTVLRGNPSGTVEEAPLRRLLDASASSGRLIEPGHVGSTLVIACRAPRLGGAHTLLVLDSPHISRLEVSDRASIEITLRAIGAVHDRIEATSRLEAARDRLSQVARVKSELLAGLGHEIGSPLSGINNVVEAMLDGQFGPVNEVQQRILDSTLVTGLHASQLIGDLLDAARIESGQLALAPAWVDLADVAEQAIAMVELQAAAKGQVVELRDQARPHVHVDPLRVRQMLVNLLANAVKYTPDGGRIWVSVRAPRPGLATVSVCDRGVGIHRADQADIVRPFVRGADTVAQAGWGLGLAMVEMLSRLIGVRLRLHSRPARGSRFTLEFNTDTIEATAPTTPRQEASHD